MDVGIEGGQPRCACLGLGPVDIRGSEQDLTLQVGQRDRVVVDQGERADACGGEKHGGWAAERAEANERDMRFYQLLLARPADLAQHDVPGVAFQLFGR